MIRSVRWLSLGLEGFGRWREPVEVRFPQGLGVLSLANESGKSTLLNGLCAVLFGLPADGIARWRSWGFSAPTRGRIDLAEGERRIRIRRDIATHKTSILELEESGRTRAILFDGAANPTGRTAIREEYRGVLQGILGDLADEEIFRATFLVTQPVVPAGGLADALRRLITGVGTRTGDEARDILFDSAKRLTRATAEIGIHATGTRPTNQRKDGAIEAREAEIARMVAERDEAAGAFDRLNALEEALRAADAAFVRARESENHARADADRLGAFRKDQASRDEARTARDELASVLKGVDEEIARTDGMETRIAEEFGDLEGVPEESEGMINQAILLESRLAEMRADLARVERSIEGRRGGPDARAPWEALPEGLDPAAWVARVRALAGRWLETIDEWEAVARDLKDTETELQRLSPVAALSRETRESLARLPSALDELDERARMASHSEDSLRLLEEGLVHRRESFERRWAPLDGVTPETFFPILEARAAKHRRLAEIEAKAAEIRAIGGPSGLRRWLRPAAIGIPAAAIAVAASLLLHLPTIVAPLAAAVILALAILVFGRGVRSSRDRAKRLAACERDAEEIRARLRLEFLPSGPWLPDDADAIERARAAFAEREQEGESIARDEEALRAESDEDREARSPARYRSERARLEAEAAEIERSARLPAPEAIATHRRLIESRDALAGDFASLAREIVGGEPGEDPLARPGFAPESAWRPILDAGGILGFAGATLGETRSKLASASPEEWDRWETEARAFTSARLALAAEDSDLRAKTKAVERIETDLSELRHRIGEERIRASNGDLASLRSRLRARVEIANRLEESRRAARRFLDSARGGPFADRASLAAFLSDIEDRRRDAQARMEGAIAESDLVREYDRAAADPAAQDRMRREVEAGAGEADRTLESAKDAFRQARANLDACRPAGAVNLASLDVAIARERAQCQVLRRRSRAVVSAWRILGEAIEEYSATHRETLTSGIDSRFRAITRKDERAITLDPDLRIDVIEDGIKSSEAELSQGAQDQLAFCLRLAVADLIGGELVLPLILDDPFVHSDAERLERIRGALEEAGRERQIVLFTQDERMREWGGAIEITSP